MLYAFVRVCSMCVTVGFFCFVSQKRPENRPILEAKETHVCEKMRRAGGMTGDGERRREGRAVRGRGEGGRKETKEDETAVLVYGL